MTTEHRQELAEIGRHEDAGELQGDSRSFRVLVSGCHVENPAVASGVSERLAYRRLANPAFRRQLDDAGQTLRESILLGSLMTAMMLLPYSTN